MKQKYYDGTRLLAHDANYNFLYGERSNGKSYWVKTFCVTQSYKNNTKFIYLRRMQVDIRATDIESYFADCPINAITNGVYNTVSVRAGVIYLAKISEDGTIKKGRAIGRAMHLSGASHFKSQSFPDYTDIIYEEVTTKGIYLPNEPDELQDFVSTIARRRKIRVWLIGNTVSRVCPYFYEWELKNIPTQEQGTIDIYEKETDDFDENGERVTVKIAVEYCENSGKNSKMFFGKKAKMITSGAWEEDNYNPFPKGIKTSTLYEVELKRLGFKFVIQLHIDNDTGDIFVYIYPKTSKRRIERVICDGYTTDIYTSEFLDATCDVERDIAECIRMNKVTFSDGLTSADFYSIINDKELVK